MSRGRAPKTSSSQHSSSTPTTFPAMLGTVLAPPSTMSGRSATISSPPQAASPLLALPISSQETWAWPTPRSQRLRHSRQHMPRRARSDKISSHTSRSAAQSRTTDSTTPTCTFTRRAPWKGARWRSSSRATGPKRYRVCIFHDIPISIEAGLAPPVPYRRASSQLIASLSWLNGSTFTKDVARGYS